MVQLPEFCNEKSEAFKAGYKTIAETSNERIRCAGKKIKDENPIAAPNLGIGFRVVKFDTSNMLDVYYTRRTSCNRRISIVSKVIYNQTVAPKIFCSRLLSIGGLT